jgi:translation initiation factor 2B subunit (eIF-2B alpha/beta/delta family)
MTEQLKEEVVEAVAGNTDPELVARLVRAFDMWEASREYRKKEAKRLTEQLSARISLFEEAMHVGHSTVSDQVLKLSVVESRWQDLEDARTERKEVSAATKDAIKAAEQKMRDILVAAKSNQLSLFQSSSEADDDAGIMTDAG